MRIFFSSLKFNYEFNNMTDKHKVTSYLKEGG